MATFLKNVGEYITKNEVRTDLPTEFSDPSIDIERKPAEPPKGFFKAFKFLYIFDWWPRHYSSYERNLVWKADLAVTLFCGASFFTKYLDQVALTNAYVSGMQEDLSLYGNQLNIFSTYYNIGYCIGQIPAMIFITKAGWARYLLIVCEVVWGVATFASASVKSASHLYVIRFFVGLSEAASFPGHYYVISSWFTPEELNKRAGFYNFCSGLGSMCAGYVQTAAYNGLRGRGGLAGWQWQFVIDGVITAGITIYGLILFPGTPNHIKSHLIFSQDELVLARKRLRESNVAQSKAWDLKTIKNIIFSWEFFLLPILWVMHHQVGYSSGFALYMKKEGYTVAQRNNWPTGAYAVQCFAMFVSPALSDIYGKEIIVAILMAFTYFYSIVLAVWEVPKGLKFTAFYFAGWWAGLAPLFYAWIAKINRESAEKKTIILALANSLSYAMLAWTTPLQWNTKWSPRFKIGYSINVAFVFLTMITFLAVYVLANRKEKTRVPLKDSETDFSDSASDNVYFHESTNAEKENNHIIKVSEEKH